jgi:hypothetical protein
MHLLIVAGGPRLGPNASISNQSKAALTSFLRARNPATGFMNQNTQQNYESMRMMQQQQRFTRQRLAMHNQRSMIGRMGGSDYAPQHMTPMGAGNFPPQGMPGEYHFMLSF